MVQVNQYKLTEEDFERFRKLISQASGIFFDRGKWEILRLGLSDRAQAAGADSLADYYDLLTTKPDREEELRRLLEHVSVQETQFFRNLPQFDALRKYIIPELIRRKAGAHRTIRMWSAGCSTGQEVYSLAMSMLDVMPDMSAWNISIIGTDLNQHALDVAKRGWYPEKHMTGLDRLHIESYMKQVDGGYRVNDAVRDMVGFQRMNLVTDPLPIIEIGTCDIIFCRNVIIYFTHETAKFVIEHFFDILNPGGYLFLGHSETLWKMSNKYSLVEIGDAFIYKKSLPRGINGRRFIPDRRMRQGPLPHGVISDRRKKPSRRDVSSSPGIQLVPIPDSKSSSSEAETTADVDLVFTPVEEAKTLLELGEYDKAVESLNKALESEGTNPEVYFLLGLASEKKDEFDDAADFFRKTIYCDDKYSIAYFHLASLLEKKGSLKAAIKEYRNAAKYLREDAPNRWEKELGDYGVESLVDLCEWKIENLGSLEY